MAALLQPRSSKKKIDPIEFSNLHRSKPIRQQALKRPNRNDPSIAKTILEEKGQQRRTKTIAAAKQLKIFL